MIPSNRDRLAPHITGRDRFMDGRRHSQRSGLLGTTALYPSIPAMRYYKGGGGIGGIIGSIVMGAVLGAVTGGIGTAIWGADAFSFAGMEFAKDSILGGAVKGALMGSLGGALSGVAGAVLGQKTSAVSEAQYEARDNKVNVRTSVPPRKRILGTALAGGALIYAATTGSNNNYLHLVFPVASHKVAAMREAYFNNIPESNSRFSSYYRLNRHLGAQDQTADSDLVSESTEWTTAHRLRGTAYLYERLKYNQNAWVSGVPTTSVMTDGALVYDPRKPHLVLSASSVGSPGVFSTVGEHGFSAGDIVFIRDHAGATYASATGLTVPVEKHYTVGSVPSSSTFTLLNEGGEPMPLLSAGAGGTVCKCGWSNNAQLGVYDYLLARDGFNCSLDEIHWPTVESGADICDEDVTLGTSETFTVSATSNVLTLSDLVPWATGTQVYVTSTGNLPAPLSASAAYYWIAGEDSEDASMGQLASSYDNALTNTAIDLTNTGTGTHTITVAVSATTSASSDTITLSDTKTYFETGDRVRIIDVPQTVTLIGLTHVTTTYDEEGNPVTTTTKDPDVTMAQVYTAPAAGQFSYQAGVYTFSSANVGRSVKIGSNAAQTIPSGLTITTSASLIGADLYWVNTGYLKGKIATSRQNAMDGVTVDITTSETIRLQRVAQARYTINGVLDLSKKPIDILNDLLTACGGVAVYTQGQYRVYPAAPAVSVGTISQNDLRGAISITPKPARQDLVNAVRGTFKSPAAYWEMTDFPPITSAAFEEEDGGARLYKDIALPLTIDGQRAQRIATIALKRARKGSVNFPTTLRKLGVSAWDCLDLNLDIAGIAGKKYRVTYWAVQENAGGIDLTLRDESDDIYEWHPVMARMAVNRDLSSLPTPWIVDPPIGLSLSEELYVTRDGSGVKAKATLAWDDSAATSLRYSQARYRLEGAAEWTERQPVMASYDEILDIAPGVYEWQARHYNTLGAVSDWSDTLRKEVVGLGAPPAAMQGLTISAISSMALLRWNQATDLDVRIGGKVEFRHSPAMAGATWAESTSIGQARPGSDTVAVLPLKAGTFLARFVDSSGIPGPVATVVTDGATVLPFSTVGSVSEAPLFAGSHSNTVAIGGALQLAGSLSVDDISDFDATPSLDVAGGVVPAGIYTFAAGIDFGTVQRVRLTSIVEAATVNVIDLIDDRATDIDTWASFDGDGTANADAVVYVRTTMTDPSASPVWSDWQRLDVAEFSARAFQFECRLSTDDPAYNILVSQLSVTAETL